MQQSQMPAITILCMPLQALLINCAMTDASDLALWQPTVQEEQLPDGSTRSVEHPWLPWALSVEARPDDNEVVVREAESVELLGPAAGAHMAGLCCPLVQPWVLSWLQYRDMLLIPRHVPCMSSMLLLCCHCTFQRPAMLPKHTALQVAVAAVMDAAHLCKQLTKQRLLPAASPHSCPCGSAL